MKKSEKIKTCLSITMGVVQVTTGIALLVLDKMAKKNNK